MPKPGLSAMDDVALTHLLAAHMQPAWRRQQLRRALWQPYIRELDQIRQLPAGLRKRLQGSVDFMALEVAHLQESDGGRTLKLLCRLRDGQQVETVVMETEASGRSSRRATVCVSTQVGCAVGCPFCATGRLGLRRSCLPEEVVDQVRAGNQLLHDRGFGSVTHVVYMGMGEPLHAFDTTMTSLQVLIADAKISPRRITVSTSGVVPKIQELGDSGIGCSLAISLHAADDELRNRLVPLNRRYPIAEVAEAALQYRRQTGRRVSFEWCLIGGMNDSVEQAQRLQQLARHAQAHVNVIPMNRIEASPWGPPEPEVARRFLATLRGVAVTVRRRRGADTDAACGQLRAQMDDRRFLLADGTLGRPQPL